MDEYTKNTLLYCLDNSVKELFDAIEKCVSKKSIDSNSIILKHGNVIFWIGACIYKLEEMKVRFPTKDQKLVNAFKAATNALKHNYNMCVFYSEGLISAPLCGCYRLGGQDPLSLIVRSNQIVIMWANMPIGAIRSKNDIEDYNEILALKDVHNGIEEMNGLLKRILS